MLGNGLVVRYNEDGTLDNTFGVEGVCVLPASSIRDMDLDKYGNIYAFGTSGDDKQIVTYRCTPNGKIDSSFGVNGVITTGFDADVTEAEGNGIVVQPDGKIIVGGI